MMKTNCAALMVVACAAGMAGADIQVQSLGTGAPPAVFQGMTMIPSFDLTPVFTDVTRVPFMEPDCYIEFDQPMSHRRIGQGWATWSHGYTGDVYYTNGRTSVTMFLRDPQPVWDFIFYAEPNPFGIFSITATGTDGATSASLTQSVEGSSGAMGWGFYATDSAGIDSVTVRGDVDFAVGEFFYALPSPGTAALFGAAGLMCGRRRV